MQCAAGGKKKQPCNGSLQFKLVHQGCTPQHVYAQTLGIHMLLFQCCCCCWCCCLQTLHYVASVHDMHRTGACAVVLTTLPLAAEARRLQTPGTSFMHVRISRQLVASIAQIMYWSLRVYVQSCHKGAPLSMAAAIQLYNPDTPVCTADGAAS